MRFIADTLRRALGMDTLHKDIRQLVKRLEVIEEHGRQENKWRNHFSGKINALVRREYLSDFIGDDYPFAAMAQRFKLYSQNEEDGMVLALLRTAGIVNRTYVEIGSGGSGGNSGMLCREFGWRGVMVDYNKGNIERAQRKFGVNPKATFEHMAVTPDNVDDMIRRHGLAGEVDFFSLDIDSFDYWVLKAMTTCSPRVMVLEYNSAFGMEKALTIAPDTDLGKAPKGFHGASLLAWVRLCADKGYRLVACDDTGTNAFFLRNDLRPEIPAVDPQVAYRPQLDKHDPLGETERPQKDLQAVAREHGLTIVEV